MRDGLLAEPQADEAGRRSRQLVEVRLHPLRAADALRLGAALEWAAGHPTRRVLHTFDSRLETAARREGFGALPEPS